MGEGLLGLLGLGEPEPPAPPAEAQAENSSAFRDAIAAVNESLQSAITKATPEEHAALDADRSKLYEAYQVASSQTGTDAAAGKQAMDRVMAAASSLGGKAADTAAAAAAAQQQWGAKEELYDEMLIRVGDLEEAGHPKADTLRQLTDTIREKANGRNYGDSAAAVDQLEPKLAAIMQEQQALIAQVEAAKAATNGQEEGSWWDKTTGAVSDWFTPGGDENEASSGPTTGGAAGQSAEGSGEEKNWWDKAKEAVSGAYAAVTGGEGEQGKETSGEGGGESPQQTNGDPTEPEESSTEIGSQKSSVRVSVKWDNGDAAGGAPVFYNNVEKGEGAQVSANDSGIVDLLLEPGNYTIRSLWGAARAQQQVSVAQGNNPSVTLTLGHMATLNVTVRSAGSGDPVSNAIIQATGPSGTQQVTVDSSGATSMVLEPGQWQLQAKSPDSGDWGPATGVTLTDGELNTVGLSVAPAGGTQAEGSLPVIKVPITFSYEKEFSYFKVSNIAIDAQFSAKSAPKGVEYSKTDSGFQAELKRELTTKLDGSIGIDEFGGAAAVSAAGLKTSIAAKGQGSLLAGISATWEVEVTVFNAEAVDPNKSQAGMRIGPVVVTPPSITPKTGLTKDITLLGNVPGTLSVTISVNVSPNYKEIAKEAAQKLGLKFVEGAGGLAFALIEGGVQTIYINYKHIIFRPNPDEYVAQRESVVSSALQGFEGGLRHSGGSVGSEAYSSAYAQGEICGGQIYKKLVDSGEVDRININKAYFEAVNEAIGSGIIQQRRPALTSQANNAIWQKFMADHPDTTNAAKMSVASGLWGHFDKAPPQVKQQFGD